MRNENEVGMYKIANEQPSEIISNFKFNVFLDIIKDNPHILYSKLIIIKKSPNER